MKILLAAPFQAIAFGLGIIGLFFIWLHLIFDCVAKEIKENGVRDEEKRKVAKENTG